MNIHDTDEMHAMIDRSFERSKEYNIDRHFTMAPESSRLRPGELSKRIELQKKFYTVAKEQADKLYKLLKNTGFGICLADSEGYILYIIGDAELEEYYRKTHCTPGYRWTEKDMGTCAISVSLEEKAPILLAPNKMYTNLPRAYSNAAAPVFDSRKEVLGIVALSGLTANVHRHTLGLVCQAADAISESLKTQVEVRELSYKNSYLQACLEASNRGLVAVDLKGCIQFTNKRAKSLISIPDSAYGKQFSTTMDFNFVSLLQEKGVFSQEIQGARGKNLISYDSLILENGDVIGGLLTIIDKRNIIELAMETIGAKPYCTFDSVVGKHPNLIEAVDTAKMAAKNSASLLLYGPSGSGKEVFAQSIHNESERRECPYVILNCRSASQDMLEAELFGYEFCGQYKNSNARTGKLELANKGTLVLKEVDELAFETQAKLLRVLQKKEMLRLGGTKAVPIDVKVISITKKNLREEVMYGRFRSDLFYELSTISISIPSLRDRREDIPLLLDHFIKRQGYSSAGMGITLKARSLLINYSWPDNVRELENAISRAIYLAGGKIIKPEHLALDEFSRKEKEKSIVQNVQSLEELEKDSIENTIIYFQGNLSQCAQALGISRPTLYRKMTRYNISFEDNE